MGNHTTERTDRVITVSLLVVKDFKFTLSGYLEYCSTTSSSLIHVSRCLGFHFVFKFGSSVQYLTERNTQLSP